MLQRNQRGSYVKRLMTIRCRGAIIGILLCKVVSLLCVNAAFPYLKGMLDEKYSPLGNQYDTEVTSTKETIDSNDPQEDQVYLKPLSKLINAETQVTNFTNKNQHLHADVKDEIKTNFPQLKDTLEEVQTLDDPARSHVTSTQLVLNELERYTSTESSKDADEKGSTTASIDSDVKSVLGIHAENERINVITHQNRTDDVTTADVPYKSYPIDNNLDDFRDTLKTVSPLLNQSHAHAFQESDKSTQAKSTTVGPAIKLKDSTSAKRFSTTVSSKSSDSPVDAHIGSNGEDNNTTADKRLRNLFRDTKFATNKENQKLIEGDSFSKSAVDGVKEAIARSIISGQHQSKKSTNRESEVKVLSYKKIVIVLAYMRTGSTLTASLLQEYKNTFYVFEPLQALMTKKFKLKKATLKYINGTSRKYETSMLQEVAQMKYGTG